MRRIIMVGAPCSGKGTIGKLLCQQYGFDYICTGDIIRGHQKRQTKIGKIADAFVNAGGFLPPKYIAEIMREALSSIKSKKGVVLDGYPRNIKQAEDFGSLNPADRVICLEISLEEGLRRLEERRSNRKDDDPDIYKKRYQTFIKDTLPILDFYKSNVRPIPNEPQKTEMESIHHTFQLVSHAIFKETR